MYPAFGTYPSVMMWRGRVLCERIFCVESYFWRREDDWLELCCSFLVFELFLVDYILHHKFVQQTAHTNA